MAPQGLVGVLALRAGLFLACGVHALAEWALATADDSVSMMQVPVEMDDLATRSQAPSLIEELGILPGTGGFSLEAPPQPRLQPGEEGGLAADMAAQEARVSAEVERIRRRLRDKGARPGEGRAWQQDKHAEARRRGVDRYEKLRPEREAMEAKLAADKESGSLRTKMFFEHITHSGGTEFCKQLNAFEKVYSPNCNCMALPEVGAKWFNARWQLGQTGAESEKYIAQHKGKWNVIANEELMPSNPSYGGSFVYLTVLRNPYSRHWTDCQRSKDNFTHVNNFNKIPLDNYETRHFCGEACRNVPFGKLKDAHLQLAMENMAHFSFVGPTEYSGCFKVLEAKFSWAGAETHWHGHLENLAADTRKAADALQKLADEGETAALQDFLAMHAYDEILYAHAKKLCGKMLAAEQSGPGSK